MYWEVRGIGVSRKEGHEALLSDDELMEKDGDHCWKGVNTSECRSTIVVLCTGVEVRRRAGTKCHSVFPLGYGNIPAFPNGNFIWFILSSDGLDALQLKWGNL